MNQKVIDLLNQARARELTAILQYMAQHYELEDKDFVKLAKEIKDIAIVEMRHAEKLAERILFLGGMPIYKPDAEVKKGEDFSSLLTTDIGLESGAIKLYNEAAVICAAEKDQISKELFEDLLKDEEEHINFFENTKEHVDTLGAAYIATLAGTKV
jgi:bacterioferritin